MCVTTVEKYPSNFIFKISLNKESDDNKFLGFLSSCFLIPGFHWCHVNEANYTNKYLHIEIR